MTERNKEFKAKVIKLARDFIESKREQIEAADEIEDARKREDYYPGMRGWTQVKISYPPSWEREWKHAHTQVEGGGEVAHDFLYQWEWEAARDLEDEYYEKWNLNPDLSPSIFIHPGYWEPCRG